METDCIALPPPQDSPKNIVNILNDDCLQAILRKIDNVRDFWNAAEVCTWFQKNAITCFPFKEIWLTYSMDRRNSSSTLLIDDAEMFLSIFGKRIQVIKCHLEDYKPLKNRLNPEDNINLIAKYCGETLRRFHVEASYNRSQFMIYNLRIPFQVLKHLEIEKVDINNMAAMFPELQILRAIYMDFDLLYLHYPTLTVRLPHLIPIGGLRNLKILKLSSGYHKNDNISPIKDLLTFSIENKQPIEELHLKHLDDELLRILPKIKTLKTLEITEITDEFAMLLVKKLPAIQCLRFRCPLVLSVVRNMLKEGKHLNELKFDRVFFSDLNFDLNVYNSIVALATGRVKITFCYLIKDIFNFILNAEEKDILSVTENCKWVSFERMKLT